LFADRLVAATRRGDDGAALADALDASLGRMELMIDRLLQISTLREEAIEPVEEPLSLAVRDVQADLLADLREVGAELRVESDGAVLADRVLLRELLRNLVQNSIKYASPDRDPVITVSAEAVGSVTVVAVRDNGVGIAPEYRERVFRLFERLDDAPGVEGLGFGLACCRRIIELHRGSIALADPPGGTGLEVRLTLPTRKGGSGSVQLS
jgi:signal transduction histidine kinase